MVCECDLEEDCYCKLTAGEHLAPGGKHLTDLPLFIIVILNSLQGVIWHLVEAPRGSIFMIVILH